MNSSEVTAEALAVASKQADALALANGIAMYAFLVATTTLAVTCCSKERCSWRKHLKALPCVPWLILSSLVQTTTQMLAHTGLAVEAGRGELVQVVPKLLPDTCAGVLGDADSWPCWGERVMRWIRGDRGWSTFLEPGWLDVCEAVVVVPLMLFGFVMMEYKLMPWLHKKIAERQAQGDVTAFGSIKGRLLLSYTFLIATWICDADCLLLVGVGAFLMKWVWGGHEEI